MLWELDLAVANVAGIRTALEQFLKGFPLLYIGLLLRRGLKGRLSAGSDPLPFPDIQLGGD
jgi:hypothetical protein